MATADADGMPHAVPVEVLVDDGRVYVWCQATSRKARNAAREGRAALTGYKGHAFVSVRGSVKLLGQDDPRYEQLTQGFLRKYDREETYGNDTLIEITPERIATARIE